MKYGSDPSGKGKFTKYDDPKKREATKDDIKLYEATQKERMKEKPMTSAQKKAMKKFLERGGIGRMVRDSQSASGSDKKLKNLKKK